MPRPSKSIDAHSGQRAKSERRVRKETEELLKGEPKRPQPTMKLNVNQKKIFTRIVDHLEKSGILGSIDNYVLQMACIAIDRLQSIEEIINQDFERICDKDLMASKNKYTTDFFKCCQELSLSPQSRAKFGIMAVQKAQEETDPLLKVLKSS
jgi:P27 family predicted phage terminase small subunit